MKTLFIFNGMVKNEGSVSVSGGDIRMLEIMKYNSQMQKDVLTTPNGLEFLKKYDQKYDTAYVIDQVVESGIVSNLKITWHSLFFGKTDVKNFSGDIVYSSCEHLYDVLPAFRLRKTKKVRWIAVYHWVEDYPWKEKRGNTPVIARYAYWLNRYVAGLIIKHFADEILAVSEQTKEKLVDIKKINPNKIKAVYCGVEYDTIRKIVDQHKSEKGQVYDAVFMKRLNYGKGVLDLLKIWSRVVAKKPDARLAIIGDGSPDVIEQINEYITEHNLKNNIDLLGVIYDVDRKFQIINSSKIFLLPTHEENWAIVIGEAMAAGVPVVVSKLKEIEPIWKDNVAWCEAGNIDEFSTKVTDLLTNKEEATKLANKAQEFIPRYDWRAIATTEFE